MQFRPITFLLLAMLALLGPATQANGTEFRKLAQLRISMTIVDSCDVDLAPLRSGAAPADARVECNSFMPHQLISTPLPEALSNPGTTPPELLAPPQRAAVDSLAAISPADTELLPSPNTVTVVTVIF